MTEQIKIIQCSQFEELMSEYLDKTLDAGINTACAEHALACPVCHTLLNEVKESMDACRYIAAPEGPVTRLEARILNSTMPEAGMTCDGFESYLTDYLDGFLPANAFHRWERHAARCTECEDLPGMVVRSIAACYTYKLDELPVPAGLEQRILNLTSELGRPRAAKASWASRIGDRVKEFRWPLPIPQLAPVAMLLMFAFLVFSQTVSADGTLAGVFQRSVELAGQTYQQSADAFGGKPSAVDQSTSQEPVNGPYVNEEGKK
jgi:anti-sigma factor RsiW